VRQISLKQRKIELPAENTKNKTPRNFVMTDQVYDLRKQCVSGKGTDDFVFTRDRKPLWIFVARGGLCVRRQDSGSLSVRNGTVFCP